MRLRTFTAADMQSAMAMVREALGEEAIILSSASDRAKRRVTVTAALEEEETLPRRRESTLSADNMDPRLRGDGQEERLISLLRYHGVPETVAGGMAYKARHLASAGLRLVAGETEEEALARLLAACFEFAPLDFARSRVMLVGPPGIGKTLAVAKMATQGALGGGRVAVITTDTKRAGGVEQLAAFTEILGLNLTVVETGRELDAVLSQLPENSPALIDTAGCNPYAADELRELDDLIGGSGCEPMLALPAGLDANEAADSVRAFAFPGIRRLLITRADAARRYGAPLAAAQARGLAFSHLSDSARVIDALTPVDAPLLARRLLKHHPG